MSDPVRRPGPGEVTRLLRAAGAGDGDAEAELLPLVYAELRDVAAACLRGERRDHTLQATALVHEAWLRLVGDAGAQAAGRDRFLALAARAMRRVLVDHARGRKRAKRGGDRARILLDDAASIAPEPPDLLVLDVALERLAAFDPAKAAIVELRFFGGLGHEEIARLTGSSERQVRRDWTFARAWLRGEIDREAAP